MLVDRDLLIVNLLSVSLLITIGLLPDSIVRVILGIPFVLFFPGYTLCSALYPDNEVLEWVDRLALSIGLSLSVIPLIALGLNYTPWGIRLVPVVTSLLIFTASMSALTHYRRRRLPLEKRWIPELKVNIPKWSEIDRADKYMTLGLLVFTVVASAVTYQFAVSQGPRYRFTEFYVTGQGGKFGDYPKELNIGENGTVILGIINREHEPLTYEIVVELDNVTIGNLENIKLGHEERWNSSYIFTPNNNGDHKLEFVLYREDQAEPYRELQLFIKVE